MRDVPLTVRDSRSIQTELSFRAYYSGAVYILVLGRRSMTLCLTVVPYRGFCCYSRARLVLLDRAHAALSLRREVRVFVVLRLRRVSLDETHMAEYRHFSDAAIGLMLVHALSTGEGVTRPKPRASACVCELLHEERSSADHYFDAGFGTVGQQQAHNLYPPDTEVRRRRKLLESEELTQFLTDFGREILDSASHLLRRSLMLGGIKNHALHFQACTGGELAGGYGFHIHGKILGNQASYHS